MKRQEIDVKVTTQASPETVLALLQDGASWPTWSPIDSYELVTPGDAHSVGEVRIFRTKRWSGTVVNTEKVLEVVPGRSLAYTTLSGLPIRDYRADITVEPSGDGTTIRWHSRFEAKIPGTGGMIRRTLTEFITATATGLASHAATASPPAVPPTNPIP